MTPPPMAIRSIALHGTWGKAIPLCVGCSFLSDDQQGNVRNDIEDKKDNLEQSEERVDDHVIPDCSDHQFLQWRPRRTRHENRSRQFLGKKAGRSSGQCEIHFALSVSSPPSTCHAPADNNQKLNFRSLLQDPPNIQTWGRRLLSGTGSPETQLPMSREG